MRIALAQINTTVGDIVGNRERILAAIEEARLAEADLVLLPELAVTGYPPEDLLLRPDFLRAASKSVDTIAAATTGLTALVGAPLLDGDLLNACVVCSKGEVAAVYGKRYLPNYGVFDEHRYFQPSPEFVLVRFGHALIGPTVCEDIWQPGPPATELALAGATVIANISASPFHLGKGKEREQMLVTRARDNAAWVAFANAVGAQDDLVFDGHSLVINPDGEIVARAASFEEELLVADIDPATATARRLRDARRRGLVRERATSPAVPVVDVGEPGSEPSESPGRIAETLSDLEEMRHALELALRDYVAKNGFDTVVLGISGGIDSALTAALAAEALGSDRVVLVSMPSRYSSAGTRTDAQRVAENLGARFFEIPVEPLVESFDAALETVFADTEPGVAEENVQARVRGVILMALSNKFGWLLLATGNKSEYAVGYATLYGDMAGGFALIKDVFKTDVFRLSRHLNDRAGRELIPESVIERPPSAELRADQRDDDSLPPYDVLDAILEEYIELDRGRDELVQAGFDPDVVDQTATLVDRAEYKRRQAPPGVKLRPKAFGRDRRLPITNRWSG